MRRKSERTSGKKSNASPEKKIEKPKRRSRRRKQSTSSGNESDDEVTPMKEVEETVTVVQKPLTPVKEDSPEESQEQVWHVKKTDGAEDGEIKKLKICLSRPPSTPERIDKSPRSKRKHSRATSSSDTPSNEGSEDKKKSKHRSKYNRESKDESDKNADSHDDQEAEVQEQNNHSDNEVTQSTLDKKDEAKTSDESSAVSTTNEEVQTMKPSAESDKECTSSQQISVEVSKTDGKSEIDSADTTVISPKEKVELVSEEQNITTEQKLNQHSETAKTPEEDNEKQSNTLKEEEEGSVPNKNEEPSATKEREQSLPKEREPSPAKERKRKSSNRDIETSPGSNSKDSASKVSINEDKSVSEEVETTQNSTVTDINKSDVVDTSVTENETSRKMSTDSVKSKEDDNTSHKRKPKELDCSDSMQSNDDPVPNGQPPIVVSRKRRWGSRPSKVTTQKSITISTDVLKEIIPDVKLTEFNEVIEEKEKKHKRIEVDRVERPVLPKIVIDNTEHNNKLVEKEKENVKSKEPLSSNRKISIVKDDSIISRPPSPPRHKQSCILFISNLVRPFTLPQLKNLLQRTGRIVENGFWIDRIKSKCYVKYENEDQAVETRHALHGVTWPVSNPKALQVDFTSQEAFDKARDEEEDTKPVSAIPGTVEDWLREQDMKRERGEPDIKPWERKSVREWDMGKNEKDKDKVPPKEERERREYPERRRHRSSERSPEPARKFKKKEEEAPAKLLDDLFKKTKTTPCIYWLPLSAETIAVKEEQRRQHMLEHERRMQELRARRRH